MDIKIWVIGLKKQQRTRAGKRFPPKKCENFNSKQANLMDPGLTKEEANELYKYYEKTSDTLYDYSVIHSVNLDRLVLILASGTIVLSANFIDKITSSQGITFTGALILAWILLLSALVINIFTHFLVIKHCSQAKDKLDDWLRSLSKKAPAINTKPGNVADRLNKLSVICLILGMISLLVFVTLNLKPLTMQDDDKKVVIESVEKLAESPPKPNLTRPELDAEEKPQPKKDGK